MSHVVPAPHASADAETGPPKAASAPPRPAPALITELHVAFSTAAATPVARTRRRWRHTTLMAGLGRILTELTQPRPARPRREPSYFEAARMSRAMDRL
jgi:hypothetical protein